MKKLLIVESPAKIKTINKFLGKDFLIMSTVGHIKDLPKNKIGVTINGEILIEYVVLEKKDKVIADILKAASKSSDIYIAPDPDREGEIIAWHIAGEIERVIKDKNKIHRITFNEITKPAIETAIKNPFKIDENKVAAQQARRVLDRWVGYEVSPVLWRKIKKGLSAGRVQSVALKLICLREEEIRKFKPEEYWSIDGTFKFDKNQIKAALTHIGKKKAEIKNEKSAKSIVEDLKKSSFTVTSIKDSKRIKNPQPPFMTSTLQQAAYNRLGFKVQKTMQIAQKLYEGIQLGGKGAPVALITYMRTDSLRISDLAIKSTRKFISDMVGKEYLPQKATVYSKSKAQDAHEAIRPIDVKLSPKAITAHLDKDYYRLYELIWRRFIASQMKSAEYAQRQVVIEGGKYTFKVTGSTLVFDGFMKIYNMSDEKIDKVVIPKELREKIALDLKKIDPKQHFTQPPARYTEASLVKELEKEGIGRPSTYAKILRTIQMREYTALDEKKKFIPTDLGMAVTKMLEQNLPDIMDTSFTAHMEEDLDEIAHGKLERDKLLKKFYKNFIKAVKKFAGKKTERPQEETNITCPKCKKEKLLVRFGKAGTFLGCKGYPECSFTSNFERIEDGSIKLVKKEPPKLLEEKCPQCGKALQKLIGRYGPFIACSGYPKCKYVKQEKANFKCLECKNGDVLKRSWRGKIFWGCSNYPKCKFSIPGDIEETACPKCKKPYLLKRTNQSETTLSCHNKKCDYKK